MTGRIFDIQKFSIHDGPGIRTTVFFKGCNLKCIWCHNPESQNPEKEILFYADKCSGCGRCKGKATYENFICFSDAKEICGKEYTAEEILKEVLKDKTFYETSNGGVTFSGGECMLQIGFLTEILKKCKQNGIHTAIDTAGHVFWDSFEKIMPYTDLFLYDIKAMNDEIHRKHTGVGNSLILENLKRLLKTNANIWVRVPIIPGVNDTEEEMKKIKDFFENNGYPQKIELLPYHNIGEHKYRALGKNIKKFEIPNKEKIERLQSIVVPS